MTTDFSSVYAQLRQLEEELPEELARALGEDGGGMLHAALSATSSFEDQTGATRAGFVAYAYYRGQEYGGSLEDAVSEVEALNPGQSAVEGYGDPGADEIVLVATSPTKYEGYLEGQRGGANSHLGPTMDRLAGRFPAVVARAAERFIG